MQYIPIITLVLVVILLAYSAEKFIPIQVKNAV